MDLSPLSLANLAQQSVPAQPLPPSDYPLQLLLVKHDARSYSHLAMIAAGSLLLHFVVFAFVIEFPAFVERIEPERRVVEHRTPLYFPRELITQKAPNHDKVSKQIDLASLIDSQAQQRRQRASPSPSIRRFEPPRNVVAPQIKASPRILPDAPNLAVSQMPGDPGLGAINGLPSMVPPPIAGQSSSSIAGVQSPSKAPATLPPKQQPPGISRPSLSDDSQSIPAPAMPGLPGQTGAQHAAIELKSDPQGADFKPYLTRILEIVRANWQRVIPEGARVGRIHGRTVVEFIISRDGSIPKVATSQSSGLNQLDLAASTSLMMSSPLPSLPAEYKGFQIRLAFTFAYNMPAR